MKLSVAWIFDHIEDDWRTVDIDQLITLFNHKTAEIEGSTAITLDPSSLFLAYVTAIKVDHITVQCPQLALSLSLTARKDVTINEWYLIKKYAQDRFEWATLSDLGGEKEGLLPAIQVIDNNYQHALTQLEYNDHILHIDNKSITHRPDLWGHRGFAAEIAILLNLPLKPLNQFLHTCDIRAYEKKIDYTIDSGCEVTIATDKCQCFASLYIPQVACTPSLLWMAGRLSRIDSRPIDLVVDCTNYVMQDIGQPMHAFDADKLTDKTIIVRNAYAKEKLITLDNDTLELVPDDIVIANNSSAIGLAGIMGGASTAVSKNTHSLLIESASFAATPIRLSAMRHKKRTEASARFEKGLDPNQNIIALERFVQLLQEAGIVYEASDTIFSLGKQVPPKTIELSHTLLEEALGVTLSIPFVQDLFKKLQFSATYDQANNIYTVIVPTRRSSKEITIAQDLIEEVGRLYGYKNIVPILPTIAAQPADLTSLKRLRLIKQYCAGTANMHELQNYAFFDESFLPLINWGPLNSTSVQNPVSNNWSRLVTTLIPGLCKALYDNVTTHNKLRFFEVGRVWDAKATSIDEQLRISGIFFDQDGDDTFYTVQSYIVSLMRMIGIEISWQQVETPHDPWFAPYQTAHIMHKGQCIGILGVIPELFLKQVCKVGQAIVFDLDMDYLQNIKVDDISYKAPSKFPPVTRDISLLIPLSLTVATIKNSIADTDKRIVAVDLVDFFTHNSWPDKRALTIRFIISDNHKTLIKEEVDMVVSAIAHKLLQHDVVVR